MRIERTRSDGLAALISDIVAHARLDGADATTLLEADLMADAAAREIEHHAQIALLTQTVTVTLDAWPEGHALPLPIGPVQPAAGVTATLDGTPVTVLRTGPGTRPLVCLDPAGRGAGELVIRYSAGFGDTAAHVPADLRLALADQVAAFYDARGAIDPRTAALSPHTARIAARYRGVRL